MSGEVPVRHRFELFVRVWFGFIDDIEGLLVKKILSLHVKIPLGVHCMSPLPAGYQVRVYSNCNRMIKNSEGTRIFLPIWSLWLSLSLSFYLDLALALSSHFRSLSLSVGANLFLMTGVCVCVCESVSVCAWKIGGARDLSRPTAILMHCVCYI